jgi:hypothetical protein
MTIDKLIEAVEDHEIDQDSPRFYLDFALCWDAFPSDTPPVSISSCGPRPATNASLARWAWGGDIKKAKALHDALHPGVRVEIFGPVEGEWGVTLPGIDTVFGPDLARAWLLAILKAKQAEGRG